MPRKDNGGLVSTYTKNDVKTDVLRVRIASKEDKDYLIMLGDEKSEIIRNVENEIVEILGISDDWYSLNDVYIDYGSWYVTYTFSLKELLPKEVEYIQNISVDIVDVVRGERASII